MKSGGLTENGDKRIRIAGGDRRVSTMPDFVLEARLFQINQRTGLAHCRRGRLRSAAPPRAFPE